MFAERLRLLRQHGMNLRDADRHGARKLLIEHYDCVGYNYRLTDLQAAVGVEQMKRLDDLVASRRKLAARYTAALAEHPHLEPPFIPDYAEPNYQSYAVRLKDDAPVDRNQVLEFLLQHGVAAKPGIMTMHREPAYQRRGVRVQLPVTEKASDRSMLIPIYPDLSETEQSAVIDLLTAAFAGAREPSLVPTGMKAVVAKAGSVTA
jgi:dTDP-4-amino-4,6-dideoxygalactose transaminase